MKQSFETYRALKGERNYWLYLLSNIFSRLGDSIDSIAYSWIAYELTGSAVWLTIIFGVNVLPTIFVTPLVAPIVEKMNKKRIMVITSFIRAILVLLTGILMLTGILTAPMLLVITLLMSISESFSDPAYMAAMPQILPMDKLDTGIALRTMVSQTAQLVGAGVAGVIIGVWGGGGALVVDGTLFFISGLILAMMRITNAIKQSESSENEETQDDSYLHNLKAGFKYFIKKPELVLLCVLGVSVNLLLSPANQLETAFVIDTLHLDAYALSVTGIASSIGMLIGSAIYPLLKGKISLGKSILVVGLTVVVLYGAKIGLGFIENMVVLKYTVLFLTDALLAISVAFFSLMTNVLFFQVIDEGYLSRMASIINAVSIAAVPLGSLYSGSLVSFLSISQIYLITAGLALICTFVAIRLKSMKILDETMKNQLKGEIADEATV
ncbi:MAG: MFS transporter [Clostridiales bacterium]|nr:MFS transporter [Clostridiales bacterium]